MSGFKGLIFDIKRYSIHDGPGLRTTIFFKGCPLRCWWCHNPESQLNKMEIIHYQNKCIACKTCEAICPKNAIQFKDKPIINKNSCDLCGLCVDNCPTNALEMVGKYYTVQELLDEVAKERDFVEESGGVTISGGEPFMQYEFLVELLKALKENGYHTAVDTTGYTKIDYLLEAAKYCDLFMYDIKHMDDEKHKLYTGVSNRIILNNLLELDKSGAKINIRIPIIPTINDDEKNIMKTIAFLKQLKNITNIDLLPYHNMMIDKYSRLSKKFKLNHVNKPSNERMEEIREIFVKQGFKTGIGG